MRNKKTEIVIAIFCGLTCIAAALYVYFVAHAVYPHSESSRVHDLNWLLNIFGKTGTAILFAVPGLIMFYAAYRKLKQ